MMCDVSYFESYPESTLSWKKIGFRAHPDIGALIEEHTCLVNILRSQGIKVLLGSPNEGMTLDSIYTRDSYALTNDGLLACNMSKKNRKCESKGYSNYLIDFSGPRSLDRNGADLRESHAG